MKLVFISHVADSDKDVACKFEDWIRVATKSRADVFVSSTDGITPGEFANQEIIHKLQDADVLVILLSPSAKNNTWLAFESGAFYGLGKTVIPIACRGAKPSDFDGPLKQPQMIDAADMIQFSSAIASLGEALDIHFVRDYNDLHKALCAVSTPQRDQHLMQGAVPAAQNHGGGVLVAKGLDGGFRPVGEYDPHIICDTPHGKLSNQIAEDCDDNDISLD